MALFTGAFFVAQVSLIIVAKPFYAIFCTSCVPHHENPRIIVGKVVENFYAILRDFTELYKNIGEIRRNYPQCKGGKYGNKKDLSIVRKAIYSSKDNNLLL